MPTSYKISRTEIYQQLIQIIMAKTYSHDKLHKTGHLSTLLHCILSSLVIA